MNSRSRKPLQINALASALLLALVSSTALAQNAQTQDEEEAKKAEAAQQQSAQPSKATSLDKVTVTGSRISRVNIEGPAPVTVINREQIEREGFQTVGDMLQTLNQTTNNNFTGDLATSGFTPNAQVINLRNLGPGYTLTLINGRRPAQYPQPYNRDNNIVNVRAIPSSIVERVEVLSGGASAIYGSDAVAGVVNIVLRKNYDGNQIRATIGTTEAGGGDSGKLELTGGRTGDRWSAIWALQADRIDPIFGKQRKFMYNQNDNPWGIYYNPSLSLAAIRLSASPAGPTGFNAIYNAAACQAFGYRTVTTASRGTYCGSDTQSSSRSITNEQRNLSAYGYGTFDFTDTLRGYGSMTFYKSKAKSSSGTEFWGTAGDRANITSTGGTSSAYYDATLGHLTQLQRVFNPFELGGEEAATTLYDEKTYDVTLGLQGSIGRFDWDLSGQYGQYDYTQDRPRLLAQAVHDYFLGPRLGFVSIYPVYDLNRTRWNTPITPDIYRSFSTRVLNHSKTSSSSAAFTINGDLFDLPAGAVGFAAVLEGVRQSVDMVSDPRTNPLRPLDSETVYNLTSSGRTKGTRDRYAVGGELRVPIFKTLTAQLAGRYDKYDDITAVDDAITYNVGLEWRPFERLMIRGSYATSFRAPDMQLVYAEGAASYSTILDEYSCRTGTGPAAGRGVRTRTQCNVSGDPTIYQAQSVIAGNPKLKEEEGKSFTAGFVWDVFDGMSMSVDYWRIKLSDQGTALSGDYILRAEAACRIGSWSSTNPQPLTSTFCSNISSFITRQSAPGTALDGRIERLNTAYINAALSDTSGIDASLQYQLKTDRYGTFGVNLGYSLLLTDRYKQFEADPLIEYRDSLGEPQRSRVRGSVSWRGEKWYSTVFGQRLGSTGSSAGADGCYAAPNQNICYAARIQPWTLYNFTIGRKFSPNLSMQFDVVNAFNEMYRRDPSQGYPFYDYTSGADPRGRRYNFSVSYRF